FFFFQAEDGIRDLTVTGVQTCALPISYLLAVRVDDTERGRDLLQGDHHGDACGETLDHRSRQVPYVTAEARRRQPDQDHPGHHQIGRASCRERVWMRVG